MTHIHFMQIFVARLLGLFTFFYWCPIVPAPINREKIYTSNRRALYLVKNWLARFCLAHVWTPHSPLSSLLLDSRPLYCSFIVSPKTDSTLNLSSFQFFLLPCFSIPILEPACLYPKKLASFWSTIFTYRLGFEGTGHPCYVESLNLHSSRLPHLV